jgi:hypothetical protein
VNQIKKTGFPGKYLIQNLIFRVLRVFLLNRYLRWINMVIDEEIEEDSDLDKLYNQTVEGLI